jgi:hypothetical protein
MRSSWSEPFLWIHLAGLAAVPLLLGLCWLCLAIGDPQFPIWVEFLLVAGIGIAPILWMQLTRPFYIFSILVLALKPNQLTSDQQRLLSLFKTPLHQWLASFGAILMLAVLWQIYQVAPVATIVGFPLTSRLLGLFLAGLAFLASNLFLQVSLSVLLVLLTSEAKLAVTEPFPVVRIFQDFTVPGWQVNQILPIADKKLATVDNDTPQIAPEQD